MTTYSASTSEYGVYEKTLVASTVDTVTLNRVNSKVQIVTDGTASVYFTLDGTTPTVGGQATILIPAATTDVVVVWSAPSMGSPTTVVKLISGGTPKYSVSAAY